MVRILPGFVLIVLFLAPAALAQQSATYRVVEQSFNAGGHPEAGAAPSSVTFSIPVDAIGEAVSGGETLTSATYSMEAGFTSALRPPAEVGGLRLLDHETLVWAPEGPLARYNLYRDLLGQLAGLGYGTCEQIGLAGESASDPDDPPSGEGYFYLVTAANLLGDEGSKGYDSEGAERGNASPCP
jgi:hypothetical protein